MSSAPDATSMSRSESLILSPRPHSAARLSRRSRSASGMRAGTIVSSSKSGAVSPCCHLRFVQLVRLLALLRLGCRAGGIDPARGGQGGGVAAAHSFADNASANAHRNAAASVLGCGRSAWKPELKRSSRGIRAMSPLSAVGAQDASHDT